MNNNGYFDERIKEQFSDYAPDVHPRIWEKIVAERERRKPAGFWFNFFHSRNILVFLILLLSGSSGAWLLIKNLSRTEIAGKNNTVLTKINNNTANSSGKASVVNKNSGPYNSSLSSSPSATAVLSNDNMNTEYGPVSNYRHIKSGPLTRINIFAPSVQDDNNELPSGNNNKKADGSGSLSGREDNTEITGTGTDGLTQGGTLLGRLLYEAGKLSSRVNTKTELQKRKVPSWMLPDCPEMEKDASGNKKYIEIYGGPDLALRNMSDTGNSVYLQKRKESTSISSAFSAGIRYTRVFSNSMSVRAGINYNQINEKFTFIQGNLVQITYIIDVNGDTTGSYITNGTRYKTTNNKYRSIDVPLMIGYEMGNGKLHVNINAGPVINIYSWQKGEVLDTALRPVNITTGKESSPYQFKTNAGVGVMAAVSLYYKLNEKIHLMAEPYFRYNFSPLNTDKLTLKQKFNTAGLRLGIRVDLK